MKSPIRVLYLGHTAQAGGAELSLIRLCENIDLTKVTPIVALAEDGIVVDRLRDAGVKMHVITLDDSIRKVSKDTLDTGAFVKIGRMFAVVEYSVKIARLAKREQIDVIHSNSLKAHFYGSMAAKIAGLPIVWHVRDTISDSYLPKTAVKIVRQVADKVPSRIVTVSKPVLQALNVSERPNFASVVHDGLTASEFNSHPVRKMQSKSGSVRFAMVGRLMPWKGQHIFLQAAARIINAGHDAKFLVIGGPLFDQEEYEAELHAIAAELGIVKHVTFTGHRTDVVELLRDVDVLVHASISPDPLPGTLLEGQAAGLAVIGSNSGGVPEMISHNCTGLLAEPNSPASLASAMIRLIEDRELLDTLSAQGYASVREEFTVERTVNSLQAIYESLIKQRSARGGA